ncbi:MAG: amidohydrolase family protein [Euryarchaeota archaeon]|nr:amidohydrolase family protein [Euryarchaeota archaeon]
MRGAMELVVEGNVFFEGRPRKLALGIEDGAIVAVKKVIKGVRTVDFGDKLVLPGAVDVHVHFRDPGMTHKEDFLSGTTAAACGGVTAVLDMPNTVPPTVSPADLNGKLSSARQRAAVDFGLFAGIAGRGRPELLAGLAAGFKLYMGSTTGDLLVDDYSRLDGLLGPLAATGRPVAVHAEDETVLRSVKAVPRDLASYNECRPPEAESSAVRRFLDALGGARGHVCHVSTAGSLGVLRPAAGAGAGAPAGPEKPPPPPGAANGRPPAVTCEVAPHHLLLDAREDNALGTLGKMNPPLRTRPDRQALWEALVDGRIDCLASDHAPHLEEEKDLPFAEAPAGVPGTETMVPLMMAQVKAGRLPLERLVDAACGRPAAIFGLPGGRLEVGAPAHLAVYDLRRPRTVRGRRLNSKCAWSPFEGREAFFPRSVFLRGQLVVDDWEPSVTPGAGRFLAGEARAGGAPAGSAGPGQSKH